MSFVWKRPEGRLKTPEQCAAEILGVAKARGLDEFAAVLAVMCVAQESDFWCPWNAKDASSKNYAFDSESDDGRSVGYFQQQNGRAGDTLPAGDRDNWWGPMPSRMDLKRSADVFLSRLQKNYRDAIGSAAISSEFISNVQSPRADLRGAYAKHWDHAWQLVRTGKPAPAPAPAPQTYGMPTGSNSGGYGGAGVKFPDWVYALGNAFGLKPSTYPGHQESDRNEGGYAPNPQHLNRGIDWAAPGAADEVDRMQRFADYLFSVRGELEQVIWWNPQTNRRVGVAGGKDVTTAPYYDYPGGYDDHRDHVHTRQSHPIPLPGGVGTVTTPAVPVALRPDFVELDFYSSKKVGQGFSVRSRTAINFFIHTEEGNGTAESLARFCDGSNGVSYHYTVRDGRVCDVVDTDYYSWSVLSANVFSINLCFAGSYAGWTRAQWLLREKDIEIAAYLAVQDCRKYNIPTDVIAPPYHEAAGISDHKYVTQQLHIGNHTDVGDNFPWDRFTSYVNKYANTQTVGDDMALVPQDQWDRFYAAYMGDIPSLSPLRRLGEGNIGPLHKILRYVDGSEHVEIVKLLADLGHQPTLDQLNEVEAADPVKFPDRQADATLARNILASAKKAWAAAAGQPTPSAVATQVAPTYELQAAQSEVARLNEENANLRAQLRNAPAPVEVSRDLVPVSEPKTTGDHVARVVDSVESWTDAALSMDVKQRASLTASIKVLETVKNGSEPS